VADKEDTEDQGVGSKATVKFNKSKAALRAEEELANFMVVVGTRAGRAVLWALMSSGGPYKLSYQGENTHETAFLEGRRSLSLEILHKLFTDAPAEYMLMQNEAVSRDTRYATKGLG